MQNICKLSDPARHVSMCAIRHKGIRVLEYVILFCDKRDFRARRTHRQIIDDVPLSTRSFSPPLKCYESHILKRRGSDSWHLGMQEKEKESRSDKRTLSIIYDYRFREKYFYVILYFYTSQFSASSRCGKIMEERRYYSDHKIFNYF